MPVSAAGVTGYARKYSPDATGGVARVANATAEHVKFVGAYGLAVPANTSGQGSGAVTDELRILLRANTDASVPLAITAGSAIT